MHNSNLLTNGNTTDLSDSRHWFFVMRNGPTTLYSAYTDVLNDLALREVKQAESLQVILLVLMIVEACLLVALALLYVVRLVAKVGAAAAAMVLDGWYCARRRGRRFVGRANHAKAASFWKRRTCMLSTVCNLTRC